MSKSKFLYLIVLAIALFGSWLTSDFCQAADTKVEMSVNVVARKSTDTINDFNFTELQNGLKLTQDEPLKMVKGASTQEKNPNYSLFLSAGLGLLTVAIFYFYFCLKDKLVKN